MIRRCTLLLLIALGACSFDYERATTDEELAEQIPDSILESFSQTVVRDGRPTFLLEAGRASSYVQEGRIILLSAHFRELDDTGAVLAEGWADRAVYHTDTENAEFSGAVRLYSAREEAWLRTDELSWDKETRTVRGGETGTVRVERNDGSWLEGGGFAADFRRREIRFRSAVRGEITDSEEEP